MSGSWNTGNVQNNVGETFDWAVVPVPCGPAGCGVMPGGAGLVAFKSGDAAAEEAAARFIDWMAGEENAKEWYTRTFAIPAHAELQAEGLDYTSAGATTAVNAGSTSSRQMAATAAKRRRRRSSFRAIREHDHLHATVQYLSAAMNGELTLDEALAKITEEVDTNANELTA